jgi:hypothetical protein
MNECDSLFKFDYACMLEISLVPNLYTVNQNVGKLSVLEFDINI